MQDATDKTIAIICLQSSKVAPHLCDACGIPGAITREPASRGVIGEGTAEEHGVGGRGLVGQPDPPEGDVTADVGSGAAAFEPADEEDSGGGGGGAAPRSPPPHPSSSSSKERSELSSGWEEVEPCMVPPPRPRRRSGEPAIRCCCDVFRLPPPLLVLSGSPWRRPL